MWITTLAITYLLLVIDTYAYPGYTATKLFFDSRLILLIYVLALTSWRIKRDISPITFKVNWGMTTLLLLALNLLTTTLEISHYPNYVFSQYHIHFDHTYYLFVLSLSVTLSQQSNDFYRRFGRLLIGIIPFFI